MEGENEQNPTGPARIGDIDPATGLQVQPPLPNETQPPPPPNEILTPEAAAAAAEAQRAADALAAAANQGSGASSGAAGGETPGVRDGASTNALISDAQMDQIIRATSSGLRGALYEELDVKLNEKLADIKSDLSKTLSDSLSQTLSTTLQNLQSQQGQSAPSAARRISNSRSSLAGGLGGFLNQNPDNNLGLDPLSNNSP